MMLRTPTVRQLAAQAGVATGTVSRVLNGHDNVDAALAERVRRAAEELGYRLPSPGRAGRQIAEVGFLLTSNQHSEQKELITSFWAQILQGAEAEARRRGAKLTYRTLTMPAEGVAELGRSLREMRLDAILLVGSADAEVVDAVRQLDLPLGLVDMVSPTEPVDAVLSDGLSGTRRAVNYLVAQGHRDIAFIGGPFPVDGAPISPLHSIEQRRLGYELGLADAGLPRRTELVVPSDMLPDASAEAARTLLRRGVPFTAALCCNDQTAVSVLRALGEAGVSVPGQVSVVGFDDDVAVHTVPALTTLRVHKEAMGEIAIGRLFDRATKPDEPPYTITTPVELVVRGSVAPPRTTGRGK